MYNLFLGFLGIAPPLLPLSFPFANVDAALPVGLVDRGTVTGVYGADGRDGRQSRRCCGRAGGGRGDRKRQVVDVVPGVSGALANTAKVAEVYANRLEGTVGERELDRERAKPGAASWQGSDVLPRRSVGVRGVVEISGVAASVLVGPGLDLDFGAGPGAEGTSPDGRDPDLVDGLVAVVGTPAPVCAGVEGVGRVGLPVGRLSVEQRRSRRAG